MNEFTFLIDLLKSDTGALLNFVGYRLDEDDYRYEEFWDGYDETSFRMGVRVHLQKISDTLNKIDDYIKKHGDTKKPDSDMFLSASKAVYVKGAENEPYECISATLYIPVSKHMYNTYHECIDIANKISRILTVYRFDE